MEFTDKGLRLTIQEAKGLADVMDCVSYIKIWDVGYGIQKTQTPEECEEATSLKKIITPIWDTDGFAIQEAVLVPRDRLASLRRASEVALRNSQLVVDSLCTPNVCDGYYSEWRPFAYRILAMTAEISEKIERGK